MKTIPFNGPLTEEQEKNIKEWVAALRSGQYKQGRNQLFDKVNSYCCLGVACEISQIQKSDRGLFVFGNLQHKDFPSSNWFRNRYGFSHDDFVTEDISLFRNSLIELNDGGYSFEVIASIIEACFINRVEIEI